MPTFGLKSCAMGISTISSPGLRRWLRSFGVRHFETQEPSDLDWSAALIVVAESPRARLPSCRFTLTTP